MFSVVSVSQSSVHGGSPCDHYPLCIGPHCTDLLLVTSGGHYWRPVQTCSFEDTAGATSGGGY